MLTKDELRELEIKVPQALLYVFEVVASLTEEVDTLKYERDEYKSKYHNECELRKIVIKEYNDKTLPPSD